MSQKPVLPSQECDPRTLGVAKKPRPAGKRKPQTEVVVQLGPYTEGQITAPELVRPLEGPTDWLIKPKTGEIVPFDAATPPEKDVIRKYINVDAQDTDVPDELPKTNEGLLVERVDTALLPGEEGNTSNPTERIVRITEKEGPVSIECEMPPPPPPTPVDPEEGEPPHPPVCPPPLKECDTPVDAVDDCASTGKDCPVTIDVLKNDLGCGGMEITKASAEHGTVEIRAGHLHYRPNEGFCGEDVITYTIGDENCLSDSAHVYINVGDSKKLPTAPEDPCLPEGACPSEQQLELKPPIVDDHEYSSQALNHKQTVFSDTDTAFSSTDQFNSPALKTGDWSNSFNTCNFNSACPAVEEPAAVC